MAQPADAPPPQPVAFHTSPVDAAGFTLTPNLVVLRHDLSLSAKLVYGYLSHLAWRGRTDEVGTAREIIAGDLGVGVKAVTGYIKELRDAPTVEESEDPDCPRLVVAVRRGQGRPNVYAINPPQMGPSGKVGSTFLERSDLPDPVRARSSSEVKKTKSKKNPPTPLALPPPVALTGGRNVPLDALLEECSVANVPENQRAVAAAVYLNGRLNRDGDTVTEPGIRHLFWAECRRHASIDSIGAEFDDAGEARLTALHGDPERFAALLTDRIRKKAAAYRAAMPGATLTPKALRDWWFDAGTQANTGFTADDASRLPDV